MKVYPSARTLSDEAVFVYETPPARALTRFIAPFGVHPVPGAPRYNGAIEADLVERFAMRSGKRLLCACAALVMLVAALVARPVRAHATSYAYGVDIQAQVQANGDLKVSECRLFDLDDDANGVYWTIPFAQNQQGATSSAVITGVAVDEHDGNGPHPFQRVDAAENGQNGVYTVANEGDNLMLKVFAPHDDGDAFYVTVEYTLTGAVMAWADTAELYWQFIGPDWEDDSENVGLLISFAGADDSGVAAQAGQNLRAWGHGPLDGSVALDAAASRVRMEMPRVQSGEFAEARVVFPTAWVPALAASSEERLPTILEEEQAWADEANARRERARAIVGAGSAVQVSIPAIFLAIVSYLKFTRGRSPKPVFQETYFRDVPSADHPAVIAAFMENGDVPDRAFVATLMKLTDERVIALEVQTVETDGLFGTKQEERYCLRLLDRAAATDPIDRAALQLYFGDADEGVTEVPFDQVKYRAEHDTEAYKQLVDDFKGHITAQLEMRSLVRDDGGTFRATALGIAIALAIASFIFFMFSDLANPAAFAISILLLIVATVVGVTYRVYSQEGVELRERCVALKRWLEDFTRLNEAVPSDLILWNKLLVMAVALGVSDEVLRQLADAVPRELREDLYGGYYYPVYWWCYPYGRLNSPTDSMRSVQAASLAALASSLDTSGALCSVRNAGFNRSVSPRSSSGRGTSRGGADGAPPSSRCTGRRASCRAPRRTSNRRWYRCSGTPASSPGQRARCVRRRAAPNRCRGRAPSRPRRAA